MEKRGIKLSKLVKNPLVIEGFPGIGLVSTITTGFLIEHLKCERIGTYYFEEVPPSMAIHQCKTVLPVGIYYNQKNNIVIIHAVTSPIGIEWKAADLVLELCKQIKAKEIITIEGIGSTEQEESKGFYFTNNTTNEQKLRKAGLDCLGEGIIVGVSAGVLLKNDTIPTTCLFAETHSNLPDSKAAAIVIQMLDSYLGLKVDYKPLLKQAAQLETKLKGLMEQTAKAKELKEKKALPYIG